MAKEIIKMNEKGETRWEGTGSDKEWHLTSDHQYIFMRQYIYSGMRKKTILYKELTEQELLEVWNGDWQDNAEKKKILTHFGTKKLYEKAKESFENYLLGKS